VILNEGVNNMSDVKNAYDRIIDFLDNETEKTLLLRGIADKEKHQALLKALNSQGNLKGLINLIHTTKDGMENFFRCAELYKVKVPKKYGQGMKLSNLTIYFNNLTTKSNREKYDNYVFDFMIIWPIQSVTKSEKEIQMLKEMAERQSTRKIIYLTIKEPWYNPDPLETIVDRVIQLDCENDNPKEYQRILAAFEENMKRHMY
jgi:glycerophosphoryl diester phosphodiesterase